MYDPLSACGDYQLDFLPKHQSRHYFDVHQSQNMTPDDLLHHQTSNPEGISMLVNGGEAGLNPASSSVWLEQGEYFFDDEFGLPTDDQDTQGDALNDVHATHPAVNPEHTSVPSQLNQSCADSCICTPGDSAESASISASVKHSHANLCCSSAIETRPFHPEHHTNSNRVTSLNAKQDSSVGAGVDFETDVESGKLSAVFQNGVAQQSIHRSQLSSRSASTSWMQQIMERSCNPDLKALLNRAAAAADYKLAYTDQVPADSCGSLTSRQLVMHPSFNESAAPGQSSFNRSLSHNNIFGPKDTATLCHDLNQANMRFTKPESGAPFPVAARSAAFTASVGTQHDSTQSYHTYDSSCKLTSWAQKHHSRESLKRRQASTTETVLIPASSAQVPADDVAVEIVSPWRAIKQASNTLVTWNQLKRTVQATKPTARRENRSQQNHRDLVNVTSDTQLNHFHSKPLHRSRSQPASSNHYMYRYSGTLLEIFMRAKAVETSCRESDGIDGAANRPSSNCAILTSTHLSELNTQDEFSQATERDSKAQNANNIKYMRHFGAQFPPVPTPQNSTVPVCTTNYTPLRSSSPNWSNIPRRYSLAARVPCADFRYSHPRAQKLPNRPQSFGSNRQYHIPPSSDSKSSHTSPEIAACLTASAGPDTPYMAALREESLADGYPVGWLRNPRASIAYPGLGLLSVPRPSRLTGAAFLSNTLPDLSFLGQAGAEEERKGTPTMPKRTAACHCRCHPVSERCCIKCGCRSSSVGRATLNCFHPGPEHISRTKRLGLKTYAFHPEDLDEDRLKVNQMTQPSSAVPDLVAGHASPAGPRESDELHPFFSRQNPNETEHFSSEPDLNSAFMNLSDPSCSSTSVRDRRSYPKPSTLMTSSSQACYGWESNNASSSASCDRSCRPKKSVSFSGHIRHIRPRTCAAALGEASPTSPEPKVIPRSWGLYGQEPPLAEFNPRISPGRDTTQPNQDPSSLQTDVDVRYHAMVSDVIKAVQETVAYYSTARTAAAGGGGGTSADPRLTPYTTIAALGSTGRQPLLAVIGPLTVLLCDGLVPPNRPIFMSRPRTRLWQMVEESCRSGPLLTGVAYRVLSDAVSQVKALTNVTLERAKFKAFLCACLNAKALPMWLNSVVANESLLNRFYCADAFVRQCRANLRGLYADLLTHLEQLLAFPFNLDVAMEARKPLIDPALGKPLSSAPSSVPPGSVPSTKASSLPANPPGVALTRRLQPALDSRTRASPARVLPPTTNASINHYPPHHLPGQRPLMTRTRVATTRSTTQSPPESQRSSSISSGGGGPTEPGKPATRMTIPSYAKPTAAIPTSPVRGKLKTALSTFRRTPTRQTAPSVEDKDGGRNPKSPTTVPTVSESGSTNSTPRRRGVAQDATPPAVAAAVDGERARTVTKLRPPTSVPGSR